MGRDDRRVDYGGFDDVTQVTDPDGNHYRYCYNEFREPTAETLYTSSTNAANSAATCTSSATQDDCGYDTFGDQTQVKDPDQNVTTTAYDGDGRVTSVVRAPYTPPGASASITSPAVFAYDEAGNLASAKDPKGNLTSFTYDALGDVTSKTDPLLPGQSAPGTWHYGYDAAGEQTSARDPLGNESQRTWDYFVNPDTGACEPESNDAAEAVRAKVAQMKADMTGEEANRTRFGAAHVTTWLGIDEMWVAGAGLTGYVRPELRGDAFNMTSPAPSELSDLEHINDAEMHLFRVAEEQGATINAIGATRPVCTSCQERLPEETPIVTELDCLYDS